MSRVSSIAMRPDNKWDIKVDESISDNKELILKVFIHRVDNPKRVADANGKIFHSSRDMIKYLYTHGYIIRDICPHIAVFKHVCNKKLKELQEIAYMAIALSKEPRHVKIIASIIERKVYEMFNHTTGCARVAYYEGVLRMAHNLGKIDLRTHDGKVTKH